MLSLEQMMDGFVMDFPQTVVMALGVAFVGFFAGRRSARRKPAGDRK